MSVESLERIERLSLTIHQRLVATVLIGVRDDLSDTSAGATLLSKPVREWTDDDILAVVRPASPA